MNCNNLVSVIIPTYNSYNTLKDCISSIQNQTLQPLEIIVVDNGSSDGTPEKVKLNFPKVKLIRLINNSGVTGGRNKGIETASLKADYILFFDHDMIANRNMLWELVKTSNTSTNIGIVTPKIYYFDNRKRIWAAGTGINLWTGQILFRGGFDIGQYENEEEVQVAPAVLLVKRQVINKLKEFDTRYFATYEDTDFCFRAKDKGFMTYYSPLAKAYHKIPSDLEKESIRLLSRAYWIGRNRILFMRDFGKNFYIFLLFVPIYMAYYLRLAISQKLFFSWFKLLQGTVVGLTPSIFSKKIIFSGERPSLSDMEGQHMAKYEFALKFCKGKNVLEIGCGSGYGSKYLADNGVRKITAYDLDPKAINYAIKYNSENNIEFAKGDAETLKLKDKYDVLLSFEVIEHLNKPHKLLELAKDNLKSGGIFIITTPNKMFSLLDRGKPSNPFHIYEYYPFELKEILLKYFKSVTLYGVILHNKKIANEENNLRRSVRWRIINYVVNKRRIRRLINYLPEYPKRFISGESKLSFKTEDFQVLKNKAEEATDFVALCR